MNANKLAAEKAIRFFLSGMSVTIGRSYACDSKGIPLSRVFLFMICIIFGCRAILVEHFFSFFIGQWASFIVGILKIATRPFQMTISD